MAVDTTYYLMQHQNKMDFACQKAQEWITHYENNIGNMCCDDCKIVLQTTMEVPDSLSRQKVLQLMDMIEGILFSSGYFASIVVKKVKNLNPYKVKAILVKMTSDDKKRYLD